MPKLCLRMELGLDVRSQCHRPHAGRSVYVVYPLQHVLLDPQIAFRRRHDHRGGPWGWGRRRGYGRAGGRRT